MRFEYNKNLELNERLTLVTKEILDVYPLISEKEAYIAASLATPVDDKLTNDDKFDRYYFIMRTIGKANEEFLHVFNDAFNLYKQGLNKDSYKNAMMSIIDYVTSNAPFPELSCYA